jgi:hypothetical protein
MRNERNIASSAICGQLGAMVAPASPIRTRRRGNRRPHSGRATLAATSDVRKALAALAPPPTSVHRPSRREGKCIASGPGPSARFGRPKRTHASLAPLRRDPSPRPSRREHEGCASRAGSRATRHSRGAVPRLTISVLVRRSRRTGSGCRYRSAARPSSRANSNSLARQVRARSRNRSPETVMYRQPPAPLQREASAAGAADQPSTSDASSVAVACSSSRYFS